MSSSPTPCNETSANEQCAAVARMQLMQPNMTARQIHDAYTQCVQRQQTIDVFANQPQSQPPHTPSPAKGLSRHD